jgi:hypothetical protein
LAKKSERRYRITLQAGFILALLMLSSIFYIFPRFRVPVPDRTAYHHPMEIISIPQTRQKNLRRPPPPARPLIPVAEPEPELPGPVTVDSMAGFMKNDKDRSGAFLSGMPEGFRPKQILEVVPEKVNPAYQGVVVLALQIGTKGTVRAYRLLKNTTGAGECERRAVEAAKASIWEPAVINGHPATYWIEKTYRFNSE